MTQTSDQELVADFLGKVSDWSTREVADIVVGVNHDDVARWRRGVASARRLRH